MYWRVCVCVNSLCWTRSTREREECATRKNLQRVNREVYSSWRGHCSEEVGEGLLRSDVRHVAQEAPLYPRPEVRLLDLDYPGDSPLDQLRNLNPAGFERLAVHDDHNEVVNAAAAFEAD